MVKLINKLTFLFLLLFVLSYKCCVRASLSLYVWWQQKKSNVPLHNHFMSKTGFIIPFFQHLAPPMGSLGLVFPRPHPSPVSHWGLSPRTQLAPQPYIGHHHNLFLPFLITCLKTNCSYTSNLHWVCAVFLIRHCYPLTDGLTYMRLKTWI